MSETDGRADPVLVPTITVRGTGTVEAVPDEAHLWVEVVEDARSRESALETLSVRMERISRLLDDLGIGEDDRTSAASVGERREREGNRWLSKGFRATTRLDLRIRDREVLGRLIAGVVEDADAEVHGPRWSVTPQHPARTEACRLAAEEARTKATAYAAGVGAGLGPPVQIKEPGLTSPYWRTTHGPHDAGPMAGAVPMPAPPAEAAGSAPELILHPGRQEIRVVVEVSFLLGEPDEPIGSTIGSSPT